MYRQYENPWALEDLLAAHLEKEPHHDNEDAYMWWAEEKAELEDRIRFAWDDHEAASLGWD